MAVQTNITAENEDRAALVEAAMLAGFRPVEGANYLMLSNGGKAIFVSGTKDLSKEQKCIYMGTVASAVGLDAKYYVEEAMMNPEKITELINSVHKAAVNEYRTAIDQSGRNNDPIVLAKIANVRRNNLLLSGIMEYVGFSSGLSREVSENINASLDIIQKYAETNVNRGTAKPEENGRE